VENLDVSGVVLDFEDLVLELEDDVFDVDGGVPEVPDLVLDARGRRPRGREREEHEVLMSRDDVCDVEVLNILYVEVETISRPRRTRRPRRS